MACSKEQDRRDRGRRRVEQRRREGRRRDSTRRRRRSSSRPARCPSRCPALHLAASDRHRRGLGAARAAEEDRGPGHSRCGAEIASAYGLPRHRSAALRDARPRAPDRGRRHLQGRRALAGEAEHHNTQLGVPVENVESHDDNVTFSFGDEKGEADYLIIAAGRGPDIEALGLEAAGVKLGERGLIEVDGRLRTSHREGLRDRRPRPRPRARPQGLRRGRDRGRGRGRPRYAPDRVHRHPRATFCTPNVACSV